MEDRMDTKSISEGTLLWKPSDEFIKQAIITKYLNWLKEEKGLTFNDYNALWEWSVTDIEDFWQSLWDFFQIKASKPYTKILSGRKMPGAVWFEGAELNYAEHVFRNMSSDRPALIFQSEIQPLMEVSWDELLG
jgi:acetoacetyl-CoA synthetase